MPKIEPSFAVQHCVLLRILPLDSPLEFELEIEARYFGGLTRQNETPDTTQAKSFMAKPEDSRNIAIDNVGIDTVEIRY
jgi:hypothetical protein